MRSDRRKGSTDGYRGRYYATHHPLGLYDITRETSGMILIDDNCRLFYLHKRLVKRVPKNKSENLLRHKKANDFYLTAAVNDEVANG